MYILKHKLFAWILLFFVTVTSVGALNATIPQVQVGQSNQSELSDRGWRHRHGGYYYNRPYSYWGGGYYPRYYYYSRPYYYSSYPYYYSSPYYYDSYGGSGIYLRFGF